MTDQKYLHMLSDKNSNYEISVESSDIIKTVEIVEDPSFGKLFANNKSIFVFYYFNDNYSQITLSINSMESCRINIVQRDIPINQLRIAEKLGEFSEDLKILGLENYNSEYLPAYFYGLWTDKDMEILLNNKSLKIIIWTGQDIYFRNKYSKTNVDRVLHNLNKIKNLKNVKHIAISKFIANDLEKLKIPYTRIPFMGINFGMFKPVIKGNSIYVYTSPLNGIKYGENIYSQLIKQFNNINFIFTTNRVAYSALIKSKKQNIYNIQYYTKKQLIENIYPQCFIALRLTNHDGLSGTVQEMGCMGIKSVHNGDSPSSLPYTTYTDVCNHIENEMKTIGTMDIELSQQVKEYLNFDREIFNTKFYKF